MLPNNARAKPDLIDQLRSVFRGLKLVLFDPVEEIYLGLKTGALPTTLCWSGGSLLSLGFFFYLDGRLFHILGLQSIAPGHTRDFLAVTSVFWPFIVWTYYRVGLRSARIKKLNKAFYNAHIETRLKERPQFISDLPIDDSTRRLRLRGRGIPLSTYVGAKGTIESELNVFVAKMENPHGNREIVDIIYTTSELPGFWSLDSLTGYPDFSFPVGKSYRGEVKASLQRIPHYLVAGESGGGKSSFIRMMVTILLANNHELEVYFLDFKEGMENQVFQGFDNITLVDNAQDAAAKMTQLNQILETRMREFKAAKARSLEMYNAGRTKRSERERRIVIVVDEISELMPTLGGKHNSTLNEVNSIINRISRMGRAVGMNLVIGTQKPDAKNLDPTIKANLMGIVCFPVTHFSQSTVILGNSRAAELNAEIRGRAIWKNGSTQIEVQTPFLTEVEVAHARERASKLWGTKPKEPERIEAKVEEKELPSETFSGGN